MTSMTITPVPVGVFPSTMPGEQVQVGVLVFTPEQWELDVQLGEAVTSVADEAIRAAHADGWKSFNSAFAYAEYDDDDDEPDPVDLDAVMFYRVIK